jgi:hypothetical protein
LYPTGFVSAMLRLDRPGFLRSRVPRPGPQGSGLAGGVLAVTVADQVLADGVDGAELLVPGAVGPVRDGDLVPWCTVVAVTPAVFDENGRIGPTGGCQTTCVSAGWKSTWATAWWSRPSARRLRPGANANG